MKKFFLITLSLLTVFNCKQKTDLTKEQITSVNPENQMVYVWSLNAILNGQNGADNFIFGGESQQNKLQGDYKEALLEWWDIQTKEDLLGIINRLKNGEMHHEVFKSEYMDFFEYDESFYQYHTVHHPKTEKLDSILFKNQNYFKEKGILAWDVVRAIGLVGWGYQAGYITKEEAYPICLELGTIIQSNYNSYEDMITSYCVGYLYWNGDYIDYKSRIKEAESILQDANSAWNTFPFDYDLEKKVNLTF